jgi:N-acetyl-anhydromuramyl-L-alanine amidase AmpD
MLVPMLPVQAAQAFNGPGAGTTRAAISAQTGAPADSGTTRSAPAAAATSTTDYPLATWVPADPSNYSVANRAHDYPIDMIVIHDIEGSYGTGIRDFQTPGYASSANYVVSYRGQITQMVREKDIAWHAGNWDYNTRAIGIEHEGFAYTSGLYTTAEYDASAALSASICSRWGVQMDRTHVIGHYQVPDPNHPGLFGGTGHHTDPGPYWNWTYYMAAAQAYARALPSPPHMVLDPLAENGLTSVTVTWQPARTCRPADAPIAGYTVVGQPGNLTMTFGGTATSATFTGLQPATTYTFTVTAHNSYGDDSATSNPATPGRCNNVGVTTTPASPRLSGTNVQFTATSASCPNPEYEFWVLAPGTSLYTLAQPYSLNSSFQWATLGLAAGTYRITAWARDSISPGTFGNTSGTWDAYDASDLYSLVTIPCSAVSESASPATAAQPSIPVTVTAKASVCPSPLYEFWVLAPGAGAYALAHAYSTNPVLSWDTTGLPPGAYRINVWVRDTSSQGTYGNSYGRWDAYTAGLLYMLVPGCSAVTEAASPAGLAMPGTQISVTARAPACLNPRYEFWVLAPGASVYTLGQPYGSSPDFLWNTPGLLTGTYRITVWVRDSSSSGIFGNAYGTWDAYYANLVFTLTAGCPSVTDSASPSTASAGTMVVITARPPACPKPQFEFWVLAPGAALYTLKQGYSPNAVFSWDTTGLAKGAYRVTVWVQDAGSSGLTGNSSGRWDAYASNLYTVT